MNKRPKIEIRCEDCDKKAPQIEQESNPNWQAYDTSSKCECGGRFKTKFNYDTPNNK